MTKENKMEILLFIIGGWLGVLLIPLLLLGITILFIKQLSDDPAHPNKPYFYTDVQPGRIKAVLRGGNVIRYLMNYTGHKFSRTGQDITNDVFWDVKEGNDTVPLIHTEKFHFMKFLFWPLNAKYTFRWFNSAVYRMTGHVFVGIWPFQILYIYKFTRKVPKLDEHGTPVIDEQGLPVLIDNIESTDHVRARVFTWEVEGQAGETKEGLQVLIRAIANVRTTNPQKALFGADKWDVVLTSTILRVLASIIRTMPLDEVLTASNEEREALASAIMKEANKKLSKFGLQIDDYQIVDYEAKLSPEDLAALTAPWRAEKLKQAERIAGEGRGEGRAAEISRVAEAVKAGGEEARRAQELEAQISQAKEAGASGGVVILGSQIGTDGTNAAILAELKKINKGK